MRTWSWLALAAMAGLALPAGAQIRPSADTLVIGQSADAETLDPAAISARTSSNIAQHLWVTLYRVEPDGKIVPYLAESHETSADGLEHVFKLRGGVTCHDGEPLTAEDVVYSFKRAADPANRFTGNTPGFVYSTIKFRDAAVIDDRTMKVVLGEKTPVALGLISEVFIHCKGSYERMTLEQAARTPVGSGPYRFVEWVRDDRIVLEKVEGFALKDVGFRRLVWRTIPEGSTRTAELLAGNVDIITNVSPDQTERVNASPNARVQQVAGTRRIYIGFNLKDKFSDTTGGKAIRDPAVRRALQYAVDIPTICEALLRAKCDRATDLVNPPQGNPELKPYPFEPKTAEALLDQAGWPRGRDGTRFELTIQTPNGRYLNDLAVAMAVAQYFSDIGVKTIAQPMEWASVYNPLIRNRDAGPLFLLGAGGATWSAVYDMSLFSSRTSGTNYNNWDDEEWFSLWPQLNAANTEEERRPIVNRLLKIFHERPPWLLMYFQPDFYGVSNRIQWQARRDEKIFIEEARLR
jgi:peptide/nickel transport system substrate-binding protein